MAKKYVCIHELLHEVTAGKKFARFSWRKGRYIYRNTKYITEFTDECGYASFLSLDDVSANDWYVLEEVVKEVNKDIILEKIRALYHEVKNALK